MNERNKKLKDFFPIIKEREIILKEIRADNKLNDLFESWRADCQKDFLDMCTGARGVKMLYDSYFKEVFNPETDPERLSNLLSTTIGQKVTVKAVLPNDSSRLGDEASLVITDIVVELEDGSIANVEVQKIGYAFTGERASCYSADLLLRQYKRVRDSRKEKFSYKDISSVYTIVLFIIDLIEEYSYFKRLYEDLYTMCLNTERVMDMFSKELQILDRNTVSYMIDEMQAEIDKANAIIADKDAELADKDTALADKDAELADRDSTIAELKAQNDKAIAEMQAQNDKTIAKMKAQNDKTMAEMQAQIAMLTAKLSELNI